MTFTVLRSACAIVVFMLATTPLFAQQCDTYGEAPELTALVASGALPPVEERLPRNPLVVTPAEGIGVYGGEMIDTHGGGRVGEMRHYGYEPLVRWAVDGSDVVPNVAESWEVSADATTYTFKLREGMKWSDGMPFSSADILFWWERVETNTAINSSGPRGIFVVDGEHATVEAIDDYTIRFSWSKPNGVFLLDLASPYGQRAVQFAKHHAERFDIESNPDGVAEMMADANAEDYGRWWKATVGTYGQNAEYFNPRPHIHAHLATEPVRSPGAVHLSAQPVLLQGGYGVQSIALHRSPHLGVDHRSGGNACQVAGRRDRHLAGPDLHAAQPGGVLRHSGTG